MRAHASSVDDPVSEESGVFPVAVPFNGGISRLGVAVAYWPGRWSKASILAAMAFEPMAVDSMTPQMWADLLDVISTAISPALADAASFP
jgi:hypothetical protein